MIYNRDYEMVMIERTNHTRAQGSLTSEQANHSPRQGSRVYRGSGIAYHDALLYYGARLLPF